MKYGSLCYIRKSFWWRIFYASVASVKGRCNVDLYGTGNNKHRYDIDFVYSCNMQWQTKLIKLEKLSKDKSSCTYKISKSISFNHDSVYISCVLYKMLYYKQCFMLKPHALLNHDSNHVPYLIDTCSCMTKQQYSGKTILISLSFGRERK